MTQAVEVPPASAVVLDAVQTSRSRLPGWQRTLAAALAAAGADKPDFQTIQQILDLRSGNGPLQTANDLLKTAQDAQSTLGRAVGIHGQLLSERLSKASDWWDRGRDAAKSASAANVLSCLTAAQLEVHASTLHALFVTFIDDTRQGHIGESRSIDDYCKGWGVSGAEVDVLWSWLGEDPHKFDEVELPIVLDTVNRVAYRKATGYLLALTAGTPLLAIALVFGVVALLFALLHAAGMSPFPSKWVWRMVVLVLFVWFGALAHVGAQALNINYSDPMKVYDAGNIVDWLSLRWLAVVKMYIPVGVVVALLWGAGNYPTTFQKLGTAVLAGYSADSLVRAALSRLGSQDASQPAHPAGNRTRAESGSPVTW